MTECIHGTDGRELRIVGRGRNWRYRWQAVYSKETLYVPLANLTQVDRRQDSGSQNSEAWEFKTAATGHERVFDADNPYLGAYHRFLLEAIGAAG